jgi:RNA polymerase subunit RPABC4/transcription elongation factor Spt4
MQTRRAKEARDIEQACDHCGALVFAETTRCPQCGKFPIKLHQCPRCHVLARAEEQVCWKCGHLFDPAGDYL